MERSVFAFLHFVTLKPKSAEKKEEFRKPKKRKTPMNRAI